MPFGKQAPALPGNHPASRCSWIPDEILRLPYFHQDILNSDSATSYIKKYSNQPGSFLLRTSSKGENFLSISISVAGGNIHHVQICLVKPQGRYSYYIVPELVFPNFLDLQTYYSKHRIGNLENVDNVRLLNPLNVRTRTHSLPNIENPNRRNTNLSRRTSDITSASGGKRPEPALNGQGLVRNEAGGSLDYIKRPPQPLPPQVRPDGTNPYYTQAKDVEVDRAAELAELLRNTERCDCGLLMVEADLGYGWAVHKSRDTITLGKIFFQNAEGDTTWILPESVLSKLSPDKLEFIVNLYRQGNQKIPFDLKKIDQLNNAFMF